MIDFKPVLCITGKLESHLLVTDAFQEANVVGISISITKWNAQITKAKYIPTLLAKAFYIAQSGRPGPVLIDITKDAQLEEFDIAYAKCDSIRSFVPAQKRWRDP
jgi:acetolactate synthase-1/2/3 large subunit